MISQNQLSESDRLESDIRDLSKYKDNPQNIDVPILLVGGAPYQPTLDLLENGSSLLPIENV